MFRSLKIVWFGLIGLGLAACSDPLDDFDVPASQQKLFDIISEYEEKAKDKNKIAMERLKDERAAKICSDIPPKVKDWVGRVDNIDYASLQSYVNGEYKFKDSPNDFELKISMKLGGVRTAFSDVNDQTSSKPTLISKDLNPAVFNELVNLNNRDIVQFSGELVKDIQYKNNNCYKTNLNDISSNFLMRFEKLTLLKKAE